MYIGNNSHLKGSDRACQYAIHTLLVGLPNYVNLILFNENLLTKWKRSLNKILAVQISPAIAVVIVGVQWLKLGCFSGHFERSRALSLNLAKNDPISTLCKTVATVWMKTTTQQYFEYIITRKYNWNMERVDHPIVNFVFKIEFPLLL